MVTLADALPLVAVLVVFASVAVVAHLERTHADRRWRALARDRLVFGVPWGTLVVIAFVLAFYLFVQNGYDEWYRPVALPYRAWSYFYPLGMVTSSFAHDGANHLVGNLIGTLVVAPIAEYAWGHYPNGRDADATVGRLRPIVRAVVVFPLAVVGVGLVSSLFVVGPVIGFSGVVYAFAGFAIVRYPIATVLATTLGQSAVFTVFRGVQQPIYSVTVSPSPPTTPSWAMTAIQGHALGFFVGFAVAVVVFWRRRSPRPLPSPGRLWIALVLFAFARGLWEIYWFRGGGTYVLYRALGVIVVTALAVILTLAVSGSSRPALPARVRRRRALEHAPATTRRILELGLSSDGAEDPSRQRIHDIVLRTWRGEAVRRTAGVLSRERRRDGDGQSTRRSTTLGTGRRQAAFLCVLAVLALLAGPAIPVNTFHLEGDTLSDSESVTVGDYTVTYAEDVENELISMVDVEFFGETTSVQTSGVVVTSEERNIWTDPVSAAQLAYDGQRTIQLGGPGWRESVTAVRRGWTVTGGETAYQVWLIAGSDDPEQVYASAGATADLQLEGYAVSIVPQNSSFFVLLDDGDQDGPDHVVRVPPAGASVSEAGITFEREDGTLYGAVDDTRVQVATWERYR